MKKAILLALFSVVFMASAIAQDRTITGTVTDAETDEPLAGVTVVVQGTTVGASTDLDGNYQITVPAGRNALQFSFIGFRSVTETVDDRTVIDVALGEDLQLLDEVVVTGYGTLSRRQLTSSIGQVSSRDIEDVSLSTAESAIQGRVSGVQFTTNSGVVGSASTIRIRGASSISASTTPLVVIDGVPVTNPTTSGSASVGAGLGASTGLNPLANLNPNDIESMEVLKDAAASAIYGSRGSNGVILITTKQGRADRQEINIRSYGGFVNETNRYDMMNGEEFTRIWNAAAENTGQTGFMLPTDNIVNTDWMEEVTQTGYLSETSASVSGGTDRTTYYISGSYRWEEGYIRKNEMNRYAARVRLDHDLSETVRVGLNINPSRTDNFRVYSSNAVAAPYTFSALYYPNVPVRNEDGSFNFGVAPNPLVAFSGQPAANIEGVNVEANITQVLANSYVRWNATENLMFNSEVSVDLFQIAEQNKRASYTTDGSPTGLGSNSNSQYRNFTWTGTAEYANNFGDHDVNLLGGITIQESQNTSFSATGQDFPNDRLRNLNSAADITGATGSGSSYAFVGYLSRLNYTFMDRYILTLTGRLDGSSRFSDENQYGFFPAISAGWIVSDEGFWDGMRNTFDFFKLRASVGQTGNAEIGNFPTLGLVGFGNNYAGVPGGRITQLANPDLVWEKTTQYDGALEFGLFSSRLRGSVGYYLKNTTDLLLDVPVSRVNGFTTFTDNIGEVRNQGWEFDLSADIFQGNFNWTTSLNVSTLQNEILTLVDGQDQIFGNNMLREGKPLGQFYLVRYAGVNSENGNAQWLTADGEVTDTYSTANRVTVGNPFPDFFGGITNNFAFAGVDLTLFFQYSWGNDIYRADGGFTDTNLNSLFNQSTRQNDFWTPENTEATNPQPRLLASNGSQASTRYLEDASYIRLKQATLGYTLPANLTRDVRARVYVQGQNLLTFTRSEFHGSDPEAASGGNIQSTDVFFQLPQPRTIMFGVNLTL